MSEPFRSNRMKCEKSCGAVVFNRRDGVIRYVLVRHLDGHYGFPKGHAELGETEEETAIREISEEVGLRTRIVSGFREVEEYQLPGRPDTRKQVVCFLAEYENQKLCHQKDELLCACLVTYEEALEMLSFEESRKILSKADGFLMRRFSNSDEE